MEFSPGFAEALSLHSKFRAIRPNCLGWIEYRLDDQEMDYLWGCIPDKDRLTEDFFPCYDLSDKNKWFYKNTLLPTINKYKEEFGDVHEKLPAHEYFLSRWWVNVQKKHEFIPLHHHSGLYSFVVWMKIPYDVNEQGEKYGFADVGQKLDQQNDPDRTSNCGFFHFNYHDILGRADTWKYPLNGSWEGTMLLFPSALQHAVSPFYGCDEGRISIAGNVSFRTV
tara:strand:- start:149 stop:817 length:669 start_codon:yes stop_codon:yes gene_type:complete